LINEEDGLESIFIIVNNSFNTSSNSRLFSAAIAVANTETLLD